MHVSGSRIEDHRYVHHTHMHQSQGSRNIINASYTHVSGSCILLLESPCSSVRSSVRPQKVPHHTYGHMTCIMHHASCIMHHASCIMHHASCIMHHAYVHHRHMYQDQRSYRYASWIYASHASGIHASRIYA